MKSVQLGSFRTFGHWVQALGSVDLRSVQRDPLLRIMPFLPILVGILVRIAGQTAVSQIDKQFGVPIDFYFPLIAGYVLLLIAPMITGMVVGFLLLDQKDDRTLMAMRVTPLSQANYLAYRLAMPMLVSALVTWPAMSIAGLAISRAWLMLPLLLLSALVAPFMALTLGTFATNKVQGFALAKALNILMIAPVIAAFTPRPWQWLFGVLPTFWPARLLWTIHFGESTVAPIMALGILVEGVMLLWLLGRFVNVEV